MEISVVTYGAGEILDTTFNAIAALMNGPAELQIQVGVGSALGERSDRSHRVLRLPAISSPPTGSTAVQSTGQRNGTALRAACVG